MTPEEEAAQKAAQEEAAKKAAEEENAKLASSDLFKQTVEKQVADALKDIKDKLDKAYSNRDELKKKLEEREAADRAAELARLKEEGKHREAYEIEKKALEERLKKAEENNVELTRNVQVRQVLGALEFRTDAAREMAFKEITGELVRDEKGVWMHKSGIPMEDFIKAFTENASNSFLFKPKPNSGGGSDGSGSSNTGGGGKSLFTMPQAEVLKLAAEGKLPKRT